MDYFTTIKFLFGMLKKNFVVVTANSSNYHYFLFVLCCFIINETWDHFSCRIFYFLSYLCFRYTDLGSHMQFQKVTTNHWCQKGCMLCELILLHQPLLSMDCRSIMMQICVAYRVSDFVMQIQTVVLVLE